MRFNFKEAIVKDWPIKLTALLLASVLWAAVAAVEPTEELVPVTLLVDPPQGRTLTDALPSVQALYRGTPRDLLALFAVPPVVRKEIPDSVSSSEYIIELTAQDLITTEVTRVQALDIQPRVIRLRLGDMVSKMVPVTSRVTVLPDSGYEVLGELEVVPESLLILGPREPVERVSRLFTSRRRLARLTESLELTVPVDTTALGLVRVQQTEVTVSAEVARVSERVLMGVPVSVRGRRGGRWESLPPAVAVTLRGPVQRLARMTRDSVTVMAEYSGDGAEGVAPIQVSIPDGLEAQVTPDSVRVRRRQVG